MKFILGAVALGLVLGPLTWLILGVRPRDDSEVAALESRVAKLSRPRPAADTRPPDVSRLVATPLFILATGPGAVPPPVLRVDGLTRSSRRSAALVSIDNGPPVWLAVGESRDGVTLREVTIGNAVFETLYGPQQVGLGERVGGAEASGPLGAAPVVPTITDSPPPGFRTPPPASAPGSPR